MRIKLKQQIPQNQKPQQLLIVEDHPDIAKILKMTATSHGYKAICVPNVLNAYELLQKEQIDLIILDWMLPGQNGLSFLKDLKAHKDYQHIPVLMLTCMGQEEQKIEGLEAGADDYVLKPFSNKELFLRIANILKKQAPKNLKNESNAFSENVESKYFSMDFKNKKIWAEFKLDEGLENKKILLELSPTEFKMLSLFLQYPEQVFSRDQLLDQIWKGEDVQDRTVDVHIKRLRQNIKAQTSSEVHAQVIETVRGFGYRLCI